MKDLIIVGASALGREIASWADQCGADIKIKGFLDSRKDILENYHDYPPILDCPELYQIQKNDVFICAIGEPEIRKKYVEIIAQKGGDFISLIHPTAIIGKNTSIDKGCLIRPHVIIGTDVQIGKHCIVGTNSSIGHDSILDNFVTVSPSCCVAGWCHLYNYAFLGVQSAIIPHINIGNGGGSWWPLVPLLHALFPRELLKAFQLKNKDFFQNYFKVSLERITQKRVSSCCFKMSLKWQVFNYALLGRRQS